MDKGAHFNCCDFQVHTPRDRQWQGQPATTETERLQYAQEFIAAARAKGLNALAITDHHDMAFIQYIRRAAADERDAAGNPVSAQSRIVVFPGMELTLAIPCQALLIFDADFPEDLFSLALTALAMTPTESAEQYCAEVRRLDEVTTFDKLYEQLDRHEYLRGRYIVIPNVSEGGTSTLLRSGHASHYKSMSCVAGYLDGSISQLGAGNTGILSGRNGDYGQKALGLFQTSDNRRRDYLDLGQHVSWIKWAEPTAEALRQACLARESRISQTQPLLPSVVIASINVSNSAFLGPIFLEFNPQYNAIIGGRGTGKSTILEYLRWALCDEPRPDDDLPEYQNKRDKLVKQTLTDLKGNIQVDFILNGVTHTVRRNAGTNELLLKIGAGNFESCKPADVRSLLPIQAYSQKQLSNVGVRIEELNRFIHSPIRQELAEMRSTMEEVVSETRTAYLAVQRYRQLQTDVANDEKLMLSLNEQITVARRDLTGIGEQEQAVLAKKPGYEREAEIIDAWKNELENARTAIESLKESLTSTTVADASLEGLPNKELVSKMSKEVGGLFEKFSHSADQLVADINGVDDPASPWALTQKELETAHTQFDASYEAAKAKSTIHASKLEAFNTLEQQLKSARTRLINKKNEITSLGNPETVSSSLRDKWHTLKGNQYALLHQQCQNLTNLSENQIRATLKKASLVTEIVLKLKSYLTGTNIRGNKVETLLEMVTAAADPTIQWENALKELEALMLAASRASNGFVAPITPLISGAGFTGQDVEKLARKLTPEAWLELALTPLEDTPVFEYRVRESEYIAFADASAGQQATALLWVLLNQPGPPLVIDQPEDDLDNKVMPQTAEKLWRAKQCRQIIFSSHNANLVVNGDADLLICCDYRVAGEQSGGVIKLQGAIDIADIRHEIAAVMEGGKEAFRLRKDKYGF
ncbi:MAG: TrlF family AAA-like ATPase [Verrucomicrobiota bacterium]